MEEKPAEASAALKDFFGNQSKESESPETTPLLFDSESQLQTRMFTSDDSSPI